MSNDKKYPEVTFQVVGKEVGVLKDIQIPPVRIGIGTVNLAAIAKLDIYKGEGPKLPLSSTSEDLDKNAVTEGEE